LHYAWFCVLLHPAASGFGRGFRRARVFSRGFVPATRRESPRLPLVCSRCIAFASRRAISACGGRLGMAGHHPLVLYLSGPLCTCVLRISLRCLVRFRLIVGPKRSGSVFHKVGPRQLRLRCVQRSIRCVPQCGARSERRIS
jgi:hypothetical protein